MARDISNSDDTIDSRDVISRIEDLQSERDALVVALDEAEEALRDFDPEAGGGDEAELQQAVADAKRDLAAWDDTEEAEELKALLALQDEAEGYAPDWQHGAQLIRDSYFTEAMEELCKDIGDLPQDIPGYLVIDWEATAENLKVDYTSVEFDGVTYWVR